MAARDSAHDRQLFDASSIAENYDARLAPFVFEPWAEVLLDAVGVTPGDAVLDVATGTGSVARAAARRAGHSGRVVGLDPSAPMLAHAASRTPAGGAAPIEFVQASGESTPFADGEFDVVVCQQGLQFFPDRLGGLSEMRRVLNAHGSLGVAVWLLGASFEPFGVWLEALRDRGLAEPFPGAFDHQTFAMHSDELESLLDRAGFRSATVSVVERLHTFPDPRAAALAMTGSPYAPAVAALEEAERDRLYGDLIRRFTPADPAAAVTARLTALIACDRGSKI